MEGYWLRDLLGLSVPLNAWSNGVLNSFLFSFDLSHIRLPLLFILDEALHLQSSGCLLYCCCLKLVIVAFERYQAPKRAR